jgi:hypothetical protein
MTGFEWHIYYDLRNHDGEVEKDIEAAIEAIDDLQAKLKDELEYSLHKDCVVDLKVVIDPAHKEFVTLSSTLCRELWFVIHHR